MSDYMLGKISRHLVEIKNNTGRPSGVSVRQYNDLVVRFNEMSQAYVNEANVSAQLREHIEHYKAQWYALKDKAVLMENHYEASEVELRAEIQRLQALVSGMARAA